jgi:adenylate cyclase
LATVGGQSDGWLYDYPNAIGPVKEIGESSAGVGMLLTAPELDGVVRRLPLIIQVKKETYPTLPLEVLRVFSGEPSYQAKINEAGIQAVRVKGTPPINTDANGRVWINFKYKFDTVSYTDNDWSKVKGKIVVIALTAEGLSNTVATPVGIAYGHEVSMQTLQMLVDGNRLERKAEFDLYELAVGITLGLILVTSAAYLGYVWNAALVKILTTAIVVAGFYLFRSSGYLIDYTWPLMAAFLPWVGAIFMRFVMEFKLKMQIKKQFGTYLAPALVEKLQKNPGLLQLGGESKELTILFSDIRGYTALSEHFGKDVQGLTSLINRYMDAMLPIVMKNEGTVGKLIGDAVMAWWSAPIHVEDQATLAIKTAREMNIALTELNKELKSKGIPTLSIGIGINTGEVVVGNMGSKERFSYDILGDAVNLASRLEGQTKSYGVLIILGENTVKKYKKEQESVKNSK